MSKVVMKNLDFLLNEARFYEHIHVDRSSKRASRIEHILEKVKDIPKPKALYRVSEVKMMDTAHFALDGVEFMSEMLAEKVAKATYVFPNIVTAGSEIEKSCMEQEKFLEQYILMELCNFACDFAREAILEDIRHKFQVEVNDAAFPGVDAFSFEYGKKIFELLENAQEEIGVAVTEVGTTIPKKTAYGIYFAS